MFKFDVLVGNGPARTLNAFTMLDQIKNGVIVYHTGSSSTRGVNTTNIDTEGATIRVVPTPGVLGVLAAGAVVAPRRRRV